MASQKNSTIKTILDTPILTEEGSLAVQSEELAQKAKTTIQRYRNGSDGFELQDSRMFFGSD